MLVKHTSIRPLEEEDTGFVYKLDTMERWGDTERDIRRMFNYEPDGCFIAEVNGESAGHVFSISYGRLGWIGLLIVKAKYRRKGIGTLLSKMALDYLLSRGVKTIKLEAVPAISNLYRRLGFTDEYDSLKFMGTSGNVAPLRSHSITLIERERIVQLARFDAQYFGANRIKVLSRLYQENPEFCFVSYAESEIAGYVMCRRRENGYRVGPWVCNPENFQVARELLMKCWEAIGKDVKLYVGVPAVNKKAVKILQDFGFKQYSSSVRMRLGEKLETERVGGILAIGGPEKG